MIRAARTGKGFSGEGARGTGGHRWLTLLAVPACLASAGAMAQVYSDPPPVTQDTVQEPAQQGTVQDAMPSDGMQGHDAMGAGQDTQRQELGATQGQLAPAADDDGLHIRVGLGVGGAPRYTGSDEYAGNLAPIIDVSHGPYFFNTFEGLGARLQSDGGASASASVFVDGGRTSKQDGNYMTGASKKLKGMNDVKSSNILILQGTLPVAEWLAISARADTRITGQRHRGTHYSLSLDSPIYQTERDEVGLSVSVNGGDRDYNNTYFGVTPEESLTSRFSAFKAKAGLHSAGISANWNHVLDEKWALSTVVDVEQLGGKVKDSPLVEKKTQATAAIGFTYTFR